MSRLRLTVALFVSLSLALAACSKAPESSAPSVPASSASAASTPTAAAPAETQANAIAAPPAAPAAAPAAEAVIASANYSNDPKVRADLLQVKRVSGGALMVKWRIVNTANPQAAGNLTATSEEPINYNFGWDDLYYVDPAENKKYGFLTDTEGGRILDVWYGNLKAGESRANWAKFPAPPPTSNVISITLPKFPPFEDVPVSQ
jgi:hypothetical protein